jgi:hypothetical protein
MKPLQKLLQWRPTAIDVRNAGKCDACHHNGLLFYALPSGGDRAWNTRNARYMRGAYYCPNCGFGNAGAMPLDRYEQAERLERDT